jgi:hypothetical protein
MLILWSLRMLSAILGASPTPSCNPAWSVTSSVMKMERS